MENMQGSISTLILTDRKFLQADGIIEVDSFDDRQVLADSKLGQLLVKGEGLHIVLLNLEEGKMVLAGEMSSVSYTESKQARMKSKGKGIMERLFK